MNLTVEEPSASIAHARICGGPERAIVRSTRPITPETTLLVFPTLFKSFDHYLDYVELAENLLFELGYEGVYQLATFHPDYCFADADPLDAANYSNRSPYAMVHLLREASVERAIAFYGDTAAIPERNIAYLTALGSKTAEAQLQRCYNLP